MLAAWLAAAAPVATVGPAPRAHQPVPLQGRPEAPRRHLLRAVAPLLIAQALDMLSTEQFLHDKAVPVPGVGLVGPLRENNRMPGFAARGLRGTTIRIGYQLGELALGELVRSRAPGLARAYQRGLASQRVSYALLNDEARRSRLEMIGVALLARAE
jgi:hypothetical protein